MLIKFFVGLKLLCTQPSICLFGGNKTELYPIEKKLLAILESKLCETEVNILRSQLGEVNLVERVYKPKTVISFNRVRNFAYSLGRKVKFSQEFDEYVLSKIDFEIFGQKVRAIFYVVYGNFYSIEFTADISSLIGAKEEDVLLIE